MGFFSDIDKNQIQAGDELDDGSVAAESYEAPNDAQFSDAMLEDMLEEGALFSDADYMEYPSGRYVEEEPYSQEVPEPVITEETQPEKVPEKKEERSTDEKKISEDPSRGKSSSVIAVESVVDGNISAKGGISIDGTVNGNVTASEVTVFRRGTVNGDVIATERAVICGKVSGDISGKDVHLKKTKVSGNIKASSSVLVDMDAIVTGNISATDLRIVGAVRGEIDVKGNVSLASSAIVQGDIRSASIQIEQGAAVDGVCTQCYANVKPASFFEKIG